MLWRRRQLAGGGGLLGSTLRRSGRSLRLVGLRHFVAGPRPRSRRLNRARSASASPRRAGQVSRERGLRRGGGDGTRRAALRVAMATAGAAQPGPRPPWRALPLGPAARLCVPTAHGARRSRVCPRGPRGPPLPCVCVLCSPRPVTYRGCCGPPAQNSGLFWVFSHSSPRHAVSPNPTARRVQMAPILNRPSLDLACTESPRLHRALGGHPGASQSPWAWLWRPDTIFMSLGISAKL